MDVYRGDITAERNFFMYALFVSFFPQLVAGPIERSKNLLKQVNRPHTYDYDNMREGLLVMLWGFFLKLVVADRVAVIVNTVYGDYPQYGGMYIIVASVLFAIQIYCDFAGYSTIAIGAAKVLGMQSRRILAQMAYFAVKLVSRLSLYSARWEPPRNAYKIPQYRDCISSQRSVAWCGGYVCGVGTDSRDLSGNRRHHQTGEGQAQSLVCAETREHRA